MPQVPAAGTGFHQTATKRGQHGPMDMNAPAHPRALALAWALLRGFSEFAALQRWRLKEWLAR